MTTALCVITLRFKRNLRGSLAPEDNELTFRESISGKTPAERYWKCLKAACESFGTAEDAATELHYHEVQE